MGALDLPDGVPRKDVFRRVLMALRPGAFRACFVSWLESLRAAAAAATGVEQPVLAVDGKTARRSHDRQNGLGALHSVSVWASEFGLSLGQVACAEKSNEITAIPELAEAGGHQGGDHHHRRDGGPEGDRGGDHRRRGGLRPGAEGEPGVAASGGHRSHRRAARGGAGGGSGACDDREGPRPRGDADVSPDSRPPRACRGSGSGRR